MKRTNLDEEAIHLACAHFDRYGGSFNRSLAALWRIADAHNKRILANAFHDLFMQGYTRALEWAREEQ